jgi:hypothetical protein
MQVPLDKDGFYTIVVSGPEDRPKNATAEHDVAWIAGDPAKASTTGALARTGGCRSCV